MTDEFVPKIAISTQQDIEPFEWDILKINLTCLIFVAVLLMFMFSSFLCIPSRDAIPLIARSKVIIRAERDNMLSGSWIGGILSVLHKSNKNCCSKCCSLYGLNLRNQHSLLSICCGQEGMNITTTNLLLIFMCYVVTVMVCISHSGFNNNSICDIICCFHFDPLSKI